MVFIVCQHCVFSKYKLCPLVLPIMSHCGAPCVPIMPYCASPVFPSCRHLEQMQVGIDLRHAAATGLPPIPISSSTGQSSAKALGLGNADGDNYKLPNGCTEPFIPQTRPNPLADNALRRQNFEAGGPDDPSTWGDIGAYEV